MMYLSDIQAAEHIWVGNQILELVLLIFMLVLLVYLVFRWPVRQYASGYSNVPGQQLMLKQLETFDKVAYKLHQLLSFFSYSGTWTEISPPQLLLIKSELEREMNTYGPLFSEELKEHYRNFVQMCFVSSSGWEHELKIKSNFVLRKDHFPGWEDQWNVYFDNKNVVDALVLREKFHLIVDCFWRTFQ